MHGEMLYPGRLKTELRLKEKIQSLGQTKNPP
jgi:hypothetical protein